jgi:prepilin-type N-terminal cleavage/methylation domain-containing protein
MLPVKRRLRGAAGYSLIELMMTVGIMGILASMVVVQVGRAQHGLKGDGAMRVVMSQMNAARQMAITQRRVMRLSFINPNQVRIIREEVPGPATTTIASVLFEGGVTFVLVAGLPDTPDAFGAGAAVGFGTATYVQFTSDGTLTSQDGQTINGTVFLAIPNVSQSARAITVLGSTGRVRGYRWDGRAWKLV